MTQWPVRPNHAILHSGLPLFMEFKQGAEIGDALILPGDLVEFTAPGADCTVRAGQVDSTTVIGVANIHPVPGDTPPRGGDRLTPYKAGDQIEILRGPLIVMLRIASSNEITCGEMVQPAAGGEVYEFICGTDNDCQRIAQALETTASDTTTFQWGLFALERFG